MKQLLKRRKGKALPEISTASLPDIIFILLFFFMVATVMRTNDQMLPIELPETIDNEKVKKINKEVTIQLGSMIDRVLVNDQYVLVENLTNHLALATSDIDKSDRLGVPVYLRVDKASPMSAVYEVKLALRKTGLRKVTYIVEKGVHKGF